MNLLKGNIILVNGGITINASVSVENILYIKKNIFRVIVHDIVKMENI